MSGSDNLGAPSRGSESRPAPERAQVERVLLTHHVRPDEPLVVRLLGTIGPDGSWALDSVRVRQEPGRVVLEPRVRRVAGDFFIQMVMPLDHTVSLELAAGDYRVEVRGRDGTLGDTVSVSPEARRAAPTVRLEPAASTPAESPGADRVETRDFRAEVEDGWIDRVEIREIAGGPEAAWRAPEVVERDGAALQGTIHLRRPPGDPQRRIEVRAIDGQGVNSPVVEIVLPAR